MDEAPGGSSLDWIGAGTAFNAVVLEGLEGLEMILIAIAVGATAGALVSACAGAALAGVVVAGPGYLAAASRLARATSAARDTFSPNCSSRIAASR